MATEAKCCPVFWDARVALALSPGIDPGGRSVGAEIWENFESFASNSGARTHRHLPPTPRTRARLQPRNSCFVSCPLFSKCHVSSTYVTPSRQRVLLFSIVAKFDHVSKLWQRAGPFVSKGWRRKPYSGNVTCWLITLKWILITELSNSLEVTKYIWFFFVKKHFHFLKRVLKCPSN